MNKTKAVIEIMFFIFSHLLSPSMNLWVYLSFKRLSVRVLMAPIIFFTAKTYRVINPVPTS